jgi:hypothetical protein
LENYKFSFVRNACSLLCGVIIFIASWFYQNCPYSIVKEDYIYDLITFIRHRTYEEKTPDKKQKFIFINCGKDLNLIDDPIYSGNLAVSDRSKILQLLRRVDSIKKNRPKFVVLDLNFDFPYKYSFEKVKDCQINTLLPSTIIDTNIQTEINKNTNIAISVSLNNNEIDKPVYYANYGIVTYITFGEKLSKFRINYPDSIPTSLPCLLHEKTHKVSYSGPNYFTLCKDSLRGVSLCFNYLWPQYYYNWDDIRYGTTNHFDYYGISDFLRDTKGGKYDFKNKIIFVGNFDGDIHNSPLGKMPGTIILFDIYLSLINGNQYVPVLWIFLIVLSFSVLSYKAIYNKWPYLIFIWISSFFNQFKFVKNRLKKLRGLSLQIKNCFLRFEKKQLPHFNRQSFVIISFLPFIKRHLKKGKHLFFQTLRVISYPTHLLIISLVSNWFFNINFTIIPAFILIIIEYFCSD